MAAKKKLLMKVDTPKVIKDAKPNAINPPMCSDEEYRCTCCGHKYKKQDRNFNRSKSPIYEGNNCYLSICQHCIAKLYEQYVRFYDRDEDAAAERICQITDMYFDPEIWAISRKISEGRNRISTYISKLNLAQVEGCTTYSDTLVRRWEADVKNAETVAEVEENDDIDIDANIVRRFGTGFDAGDYDSMQYEYQNWVERYGEPIDKRQEELYVSICYMKLNLQKLLQKGDTSIGAAANSYKSQIEAATTEIEDRIKKAESEKQLSPLGEMIRDIEEYCPAEYYRDKKLFADFDKLREYIDRFMTRPLRNLLTGSKELDKEFSLSDVEE